MLTKVCVVKAMVFPLVMYGCESWTIKKADSFELWCWRRLLRVPWTSRRWNQSILKETSPEYSLEGLMLKLQYFGYLMQSTDSLRKTWCFKRLSAREGADRGWDGWMASATPLTWVWASSGYFWWTGNPGMLQSMGLQRFNTTEWLKWIDPDGEREFLSTPANSYFLSHLRWGGKGKEVSNILQDSGFQGSRLQTL